MKRRNRLSKPMMSPDSLLVLALTGQNLARLRKMNSLQLIKAYVSHDAFLEMLAGHETSGAQHGLALLKVLRLAVGEDAWEKLKFPAIGLFRALNLRSGDRAQERGGASERGLPHAST
jgi:hypothetical protein